jgi:putative FmdB family regulatory protein
MVNIGSQERRVPTSVPNPEDRTVPTYQYVCTECGEDLEAVQKFSDDPLTECPSCSGRLRKRFSAVGVVFKGSGFYKTDSRSGTSSSSSKPKTETPAASGSEATSSSSSSSSDSSTKDSSSTSTASTTSTSAA